MADAHTAPEPVAVRPIKPTVFTAANARDMAIRSAAARRKRKEAEALAILEADKPTPIPKLSPLTQPQDSEPDKFTTRSLSRVRYQLERLDGMMRREKDPARLDRLASAFGKLSEVERQLAGRPMPGSLRPEGKAKSNMFTRPGPAPSAPVQPAKFEQE